MVRHFLGLYLLIVLTLAAVSWSQDKLLQAYGMEDTGDERSQALTLYAVESELKSLPEEKCPHVLAGLRAKSGGNLELFASSDIAGRETLNKLRRGGIAYMQAAAGESWALEQLDEEHVLALKSVEPETQRSLLEWTLTLLFYAAIALVLMIWIWPLTRDLRALERAAARYGDKNWVFDADIKPRSQIHALADTFRKMAARIDGLIA